MPAFIQRTICLLACCMLFAAISSADDVISESTRSTHRTAAGMGYANSGMVHAAAATTIEKIEFVFGV